MRLLKMSMIIFENPQLSDLFFGSFVFDQNVYSPEFILAVYDAKIVPSSP